VLEVGIFAVGEELEAWDVDVELLGLEGGGCSVKGE